MQILPLGSGTTLRVKCFTSNWIIGRNNWQICPPLRLPYDHPRPKEKNYRGQVLSFALGSGLTKQLQEFSRQEGVTLFMTLLAAFQAVLSNRSGQMDLAVGTGIAGRNQLAIEGLIGFFVN